MPGVRSATARGRALCLRGLLRPDRARVRPCLAFRTRAAGRDREWTSLALALRAPAPGRRARLALRGRLDAAARGAAARNRARHRARAAQGRLAQPRALVTWTAGVCVR